MQCIAINKTWNGEELPIQHHANVMLTMDKGHLMIEIDAPFYDGRRPQTPAGFTDGLWNFDVVELFIVGKKQRYIELEFGPYGHYLGYRFNGVRNKNGVLSEIDYVATIVDNRWHAKASIPQSTLPLKETAGWRLNGTAIHGATNARVYHSHTTLTGDTPDYHQPDLFITPLIG
jgi:hypothetical protein